MLHKHDDFASRGLEPGGRIPRSVLSGRTNDEVKADPDKLWRSDLPAERATVTLRAPDVVRPRSWRQLDALRPAGGTWSVFGRELRVTNLDKVLFPARRREQARHQAGLHPLRGPDRPHRCCPT